MLMEGRLSMFYATLSKCKFLGRIKYAKRRNGISVTLNYYHEKISIHINVCIYSPAILRTKEKYAIQGEFPDNSRCSIFTSLIISDYSF